MKQFEIYATKNGESFSHSEVTMFNTEQEAIDYSRGIAYDLYYWHPKRDIMDIMVEDKVDEDTASLIFQKEMDSAVFYNVKEVEHNEQS